MPYCLPADVVNTRDKIDGDTGCDHGFKGGGCLEHNTLMTELEAKSHGDFINYMRMEPVMFREILIQLSERIHKKTARFRGPFEPGLKLAITL